MNQIMLIIKEQQNSLIKRIIPTTSKNDIRKHIGLAIENNGDEISIWSSNRKTPEGSLLIFSSDVDEENERGI